MVSRLNALPIDDLFGTTSFLQRVLVRCSICKFQSYLFASCFNYPTSNDVSENARNTRCIYTHNHPQSTNMIIHSKSECLSVEQEDHVMSA
jgi:hypothetical protein